MSNIYTSYQHQSQNFKPENLSAYTLCLHINENRLIYSILNDTHKILALKEYRSKTPVESAELLEEAYNQDQFLKGEFARTKVIYGARDFSLIPKPHFSEKQTRAFVNAMVKENLELDHVTYSDVGFEDAVAVYTIPFPVKRKCDHYFRRPEYFPYCQIAVGMSYDLKEDDGNLIVISVFENHVMITAIKQNKLMVCNTFEYREVTDIVYFVQLIAEVANFKEQSFDIFFTGEFELDSELMRGLKKYIPGMRVPSQELKSSFETQSDKLPTWKYAFMAY